MIWVDPGTFTMGQDGVATPVHEVTLTKGFYLGKYEVTQAQYEAVMNNNPSKFKSENRPVERVSWNDAIEFCDKLTEIERKAGRLPEGMVYSLPTEAQWEYACRADTTTVYSWGDTINSSNATYRSGSSQTRDVGSHDANPWGFFDMHGNVWEWTADTWGSYPTGAQTDPFNVGTTGSSRAIRGGSLLTTGRSLRSATRNGSGPGSHD